MSLDLKLFQYKRMLEERRGHNYQYPNNKQQIKLDELGYKHHLFNGRDDTTSELLAIEVVKDYRSKNYYSRIVCYPNEIIGLKTFSVVYRLKNKTKSKTTIKEKTV